MEIDRSHVVKKKVNGPETPQTTVQDNNRNKSNNRRQILRRLDDIKRIADIKRRRKTQDLIFRLALEANYTGKHYNLLKTVKFLLKSSI